MLVVIFPQIPGLSGIMNVPHRHLLLIVIFFQVLLQEGPGLHLALEAQLDGIPHASLPSGLKQSEVRWDSIPPLCSPPTSHPEGSLPPICVLLHLPESQPHI